jgi:hypothetical protein
MEFARLIVSSQRVTEVLLHRLFLDLINEDCQAFCEEWNNHPISGLGEGLSPNVSGGERL